MKTKEQLLILFENNKGCYFSGEEIAEALSVSRTAVWKAVKTLRDDGYRIDAVPNRGYRLAEDSDILSAQGICRYLAPDCAMIRPEIFPVLDSTNRKVREQAAAGEPEGYTTIALQQTAGKGRRGHHFYSPAGTGIYMSLLLRPADLSAQDASRLTTTAAVAACEAIEDVSGKEALIKWVNDIFVNGKKAAGILTEASVSVENGLLEYAVLGIGINALPPEDGFPDDIRDIAGAVFDGPVSDGKNRLAAEFLNRFMSYYHAPQDAVLYSRYRERCFVIGRTVQVFSANGSRTAKVLDLGDDFRLIVEYENGEKEALISGELSVKI